MKTLKSEIGKLLTPPKAFFDWCNAQIPTYEWKNKNRTILASERKGCAVIKKRLTKNSNLNKSEKLYSFAIILVSTKRIEIQTHDYWVEIVDGKESITYELSNFERFSKGTHIKAHLWKETWFKGLIQNYGYMTSPYTNTKFYSNNWLDKLQKISELQYISLPELMNHWEIKKFYKYRNEIEFLEKINAKKAIRSMVYPRYSMINGVYRKETDLRFINRKWLKRNKHLLKNDKFTVAEILLEEACRKRKGKKVLGIEKYLDYRDFKDIPKKIGIVKFQNWVIKHKVNFEYYKDYLSMLKDLNLPLDTQKVIIPDNLKESHAEAVKKLNLLRAEEEKRANERIRKEREQREMAYAETIGKRKRLEQIIGDYAFILPNSLSEIIQEGKELAHCVGGSNYLEGHAQGKTTIIFVRDKKEPTKPLYTMEYKNKKIKQLYGYDDEKAPDEVREIVNQWLEFAKAI